MIETKVNPLLIIGMHRSGTSLLTRFLEQSGIFMGNDKGAMDESNFFQKINIWSLFQAGCTWDNTYNIQFIDKFLIDHLKMAIERRLSSFWINKYTGKKRYLKYRTVKNFDFLWGWKDPRNTLLLPLWSEIFPDARIIHIYRNPIDVAESLYQREKRLERNYKKSFTTRKVEKFLLKGHIYNLSLRVKHLEEGIRLWEEYTELALQAGHFFKNVFNIKYEDFLNNPESILLKLGDFLGFAPNKNLIDSTQNKIDPSRSFAFFNDKKLVDLYKKNKSNPLIEKLGYGKIE